MESVILVDMQQRAKIPTVHVAGENTEEERQEILQTVTDFITRKECRFQPTQVKEPKQNRMCNIVNLQ